MPIATPLSRKPRVSRGPGPFQRGLTILLLLLNSWTWVLAQDEPFKPPLTTDEGFKVPQPGYQFRFPHDDGAHPGFKVEWWYITGHLFTESNRRFGFEATFFRFANRVSTDQEISNPGAFESDVTYMAHMAVTDIGGQSFNYQERLNRSGWDAYSKVGTLDVRNGNWSLKILAYPDKTMGPTMQLNGGIDAKVAFKLTLKPTKPRSIFGKDGVERKAANATSASHYITYTRLATSGKLTIDGKTHDVTGSAWMDHEISSSQLGDNQDGWDWTSIHLEDGRDIMAYRLRTTDGKTDPFSVVAWIDRDGNITQYTPTDFKWIPKRHWTSPATGGKYPIEWIIETKSPDADEPIRLHIKPLMDNQELQGERGGVAYWEGACDVYDEEGKRIGRAYLELSGYVDRLSTLF